MFEYTVFKVFNIVHQNRSGQNRRFAFSQYMTDTEIERWIFNKYGSNKYYTVLSRRCAQIKDD